jgi:hypothetical protein
MPGGVDEVDLVVVPESGDGGVDVSVFVHGFPVFPDFENLVSKPRFKPFDDDLVSRFDSVKESVGYADPCIHEVRFYTMATCTPML